MKSSPETSKIQAALVAAAATLKNPKATATVTTPQYSHSFAPLNEIVDDVRASLALHDLAALQEAVTDEHGRAGVTTRIVHTSGEWLELGPLYLPSGNTAQAYGSSTTYARRYSLCAALLIAADEDDDGKASTATGAPSQPSKAEPRSSRSDGVGSRGSSSTSGSRAGRAGEGQRPSGPDNQSGEQKEYGVGGEKTATQAEVEGPPDVGAGGSVVPGHGEGPGSEPSAPTLADLKKAAGGPGAARAWLESATGRIWTPRQMNDATPDEIAQAMAWGMLK